MNRGSGVTPNGCSLSPKCSRNLRSALCMYSVSSIRGTSSPFSPTFVTRSCGSFIWVHFLCGGLETAVINLNLEIAAEPQASFGISCGVSPERDVRIIETAKLIRYRIPELESRRIAEAIPLIRPGFDLRLDARGYPERHPEPPREYG